ncbi:MAG: DUF3313 family protein, partial [Phycisphaerales bacterium]
GGALNDDPYRQSAIESALDGGPRVDRADGVDFSRYTRVCVAMPTVAPDATQSDEVSDEQLEKLRNEFASRMVEAFGKASRPASMLGEGAAGAGAIVIRTEIVRAVPNKPLRNIAPQTQLTRTGYGYASVRMYIEDGATGQTLVTMTDTQSTKRIGAAKLSEWGTVEKAFEFWAGEAVKLTQQ